MPSTKSRKKSIVAVVLLTGSVLLVCGLVYWWLCPGNLRTLEGYKSGITSLTFSPDGKILVSSSNDTTVMQWDLQSRGGGTTVCMATGTIASIAMSPDGKTLGVATNEAEETRKSGLVRRLANDDTSQARFIEFPSGKRTRDFRGDCDVPHVAFSRDGKLFATGSHGGMIRFWNTDKGNLEMTIDLEKDQKERSHIYEGEWFALSPDSRFVAAYRRKEILVYELPTGKKKLTLAGDDVRINSVIVSPDNKLIAGTCNDGTATIWDAATGEKKFTISNLQKRAVAARFSQDGKILAVTSTVLQIPFVPVSPLRSQLRFFDVENGVELVAYDAHLSSDNYSSPSTTTIIPDLPSVATNVNDNYFSRSVAN